MKNKLNLFVVATFLALFPIGGFVFAQTAGQGRGEVKDDPDLRIIKENTRTVNGKIFPKIISAAKGTTTAQSICVVGDTRNMMPIDFYQESPGTWGDVGKQTYNEVTPYSPPIKAWVISSYSLTDLSMTGAGRTLTAFPANYVFVSSNEFTQTSKDLKNYVLGLNILDKFKADLNIKLDEISENYSSYASSLAGSDASVALHVILTNKGWQKGRSWYKGQVNTTELCTPPEIQDPVLYRKTIKDWIDDTVSKLPNKGKGIVATPRDIKNITTRESAPVKPEVKEDQQPSPPTIPR